MNTETPKGLPALGTRVSYNNDNSGAPFKERGKVAGYILNAVVIQPDKGGRGKPLRGLSQFEIYKGEQ